MFDAEPDQGGTDERARRKVRGAFATPLALVVAVVEGVLPAVVPGRVVTIVDPACGDGRFLVMAARAVAAVGGQPCLLGVDSDPGAVQATRAAVATLVTELGPLDARVVRADALAHDWGGAGFDLVVGNPPYLSQLAARTTRGRASPFGGGPYADAAAEFLALAVRLARPGGGRVGLVLPQSILSSRDVGPIRAAVVREAAMCWSWFAPGRHFDADVVVCALGFERRAEALADDGAPEPTWTSVVTERLGVPALPPLAVDGTLGQRAAASANFRDEYYGLAPGVGDHDSGPPLLTSGLIDPGRSNWGDRSARYAGRSLHGPRVDVAALSAPMRRWVERLLVPKVLVANQTRVIEAVADPDGAWLPAVPVVTVVPRPGVAVDDIAAVLTSPVASVWAWHRAAGAGLSARSLRVGPRLIEALPWPAGALDRAVARLRSGDVPGCGADVDAAYGVTSRELASWWQAALPGSATTGRAQSRKPGLLRDSPS